MSGRLSATYPPEASVGGMPWMAPRITAREKARTPIAEDYGKNRVTSRRRA